MLKQMDNAGDDQREPRLTVVDGSEPGSVSSKNGLEVHGAYISRDERMALRDEARRYRAEIVAQTGEPSAAAKKRAKRRWKRARPRIASPAS